MFCFGSISLTYCILALLGCGRTPEKVDVCIVVGTSRKHGLVWRDIVRGIAELSNKMSISPSTTRLALITVGSHAKMRIKLGACTNRECFKAELKKVRYQTLTLRMLLLVSCCLMY